MRFSAERALENQLILLSGEEHELRHRALQALLVAAASEEDLEREEFDAGSSLPSDWLGSASTVPFLSERRIVVVRHLLRFNFGRVKDDESQDGSESAPARKELEIPLGPLPSTALLILVADEENGDDQRQQKQKALRAIWEKLVRSAGGHIESFSTDARTLPASLRAEAQSLGKKMSESAAQLLAEMTGFGFSRANDELQKLAIFVGSKAEIREGDIRAVVVPAREWNVWKLIDTLLGGEVGEALRQLRNLVGSQNKAEDAAMRSILPQMSRNLRLLWQARLCLDARASLSKVPDDIAAQFPEKNNILKEKEFVRGKVMRAAQRVDLDRITRCLEIISETDARLKGLSNQFGAMDTLERMVLEIAGTVTALNVNA